MYLLLLFLTFTTTLLSLSEGNPIVQTKYGPVGGKTLKLHSGKLVSRFLGVPFAKPPVGNLRWKPPQEPDPWEPVYSANTLNAACIQAEIGYLWLTHPLWSKYDEDCLYLNIFTPNHNIKWRQGRLAGLSKGQVQHGMIPDNGFCFFSAAGSDKPSTPVQLILNLSPLWMDTSKGPYPVMVYLHGGGYVSSGNIQYPGHFLAGKDVVVVVPNYRLGIFGFLSTNDSAARGNFGLLDQIQAFKFVQENIAAFGGDPNRVTAFGQSAGAASSSLLSLSPRAKGLIHQVIAQSGSDQAIWAVNPPMSHPEDYTLQVAKKLNCLNDTSEGMLDCMRAIDAKTLYDNSGFSCTPGFFCQGFAPVVDGEGGVLPEDPWTMREKGQYADIPVISGQCSEDGSLYTASLIPESLERGFNRTEFEYHLRKDLLDMFSPNFPDAENDVFEAMNWYYSPWPHIDDEDLNREAFNTLITDFGFGFTGDIMMKSQSKHNAVYHYLLGYRSKNAKAIVPEWIGVPHNGELPYMLGWPLLQKNSNIRWDSGIMIDLIKWDEEDIEWAEFFLTLWTNFAKYGNPTPEPVKTPGGAPMTWKNFTEEKQHYWSMYSNNVEEKVDYRQRSFAFWGEYAPYVAGVDFIRPHKKPVMQHQSRKPVKKFNSRSLEKQFSSIFKEVGMKVKMQMK